MVSGINRWEPANWISTWDQPFGNQQLDPPLGSALGISQWGQQIGISQWDHSMRSASGISKWEPAMGSTSGISHCVQEAMAMGSSIGKSALGSNNEIIQWDQKWDEKRSLGSCLSGGSKNCTKRVVGFTPYCSWHRRVICFGGKSARQHFA